MKTYLSGGNKKCVDTPQNRTKISRTDNPKHYGLPNIMDFIFGTTTKI